MMKKCLARHAWWLLTISMMSAILFIQCVCNNPSREKFSKPTGSSNPPNPPGPHGGAMVKRARQKGASDFLIKKLQEIENKGAKVNMDEQEEKTQNTALHEAVLLGDIELMEYLLAHLAVHCADLTHLLDTYILGKINRKYETPYDIAFRKGLGKNLIYGIFKGLRKLVVESPTSNPMSELTELSKIEEEIETREREHDLKFKGGKIFRPNLSDSNVKSVERCVEFIRKKVDGLNDTTPLDDESKQKISKLFNFIKKTLQEIQEGMGGIEKCLNMTEKSPRINYEQEAKNLLLAKQLIKDLESYQEGLCNFLAPRRKELNNIPEIEAAYKEVEKRKVLANSR